MWIEIIKWKLVKKKVSQNYCEKVLTYEFEISIKVKKNIKRTNHLKKAIVKKPIEIYCSLIELQ